MEIAVAVRQSLRCRSARKVTGGRELERALEEPKTLCGQSH